jgi:hypothetical protein
MPILSRATAAIAAAALARRGAARSATAAAAAAARFSGGGGDHSTAAAGAPAGEEGGKPSSGPAPSSPSVQEERVPGVWPGRSPDAPFGEPALPAGCSVHMPAAVVRSGSACLP